MTEEQGQCGKIPNRQSMNFQDGTCPGTMTECQEGHLQEVKTQFLQEVDEKYRAGVKEHGGNLWEHSHLWLIEQAMQECVDQYVYLSTVKKNLLQAGAA